MTRLRDMTYINKIIGFLIAMNKLDLYPKISSSDANWFVYVNLLADRLEDKYGE